MLRRRPSTRLSAHQICSPRSSKRSQRWLPIKPAPPVTRVRMSLQLSVMQHANQKHSPQQRYEASLAFVRVLLFSLVVAAAVSILVKAQTTYEVENSMTQCQMGDLNKTVSIGIYVEINVTERTQWIVVAKSAECYDPATCCARCVHRVYDISGAP